MTCAKHETFPLLKFGDGWREREDWVCTGVATVPYSKARGCHVAGSGSDRRMFVLPRATVTQTSVVTHRHLSLYECA